MKMKITAVFAAAIISAAALSACSSTTTTTSVGEQMQQLTDNLGASYNATGIDAQTLDDFFSTLAGSRYRLSGTVSDYTVNEYTEGYKIATATITNGDTKYMISLESTDESLTDGEYIEVEGNLGTTITADTTNGYGSFTLSDCTVVDRNSQEEAQ